MRNRQISPPPHKRRIKYVDQKVQLKLLVALVLFELFLTALGSGFLYLEFNAMLEAQLYSVHLAHDGGYRGLMERVLTVLAWVTLLNIVALWVADRYWLRYVGRLMGKLEQSIGKLKRLDLRPPRLPADEHRLLDLLSDWMEKERQIAADVRVRLQRLQQRLDSAGPADKQQLLEEIEVLYQVIRRQTETT